MYECLFPCLIYFKSFIVSYILAIETAVPIYQHKQTGIATFFQNQTSDVDLKRKIKYVSDKSGIENRYSVINDFDVSTSDKELFIDGLQALPSLTKRMELYKLNAINLAVEAIQKIDDFQNLKSSITHIITVTCTGLFAPGLDIELIQKLQLKPNTQRSSVNFMGCNAAIIALNQANAICQSLTNSKVLIVCVELCTIHFQDNSTEDNIVSNALFADGAAAVLISSEPNKVGSFPLIKIEKFSSFIINQSQGEMAWQLSETGFLMNLSSYVSKLVNGNMVQFFKDSKLDTKNVDFWAIHPGGKKIVDEFAEVLNLKNNELNSSYEILKNYGNMSSPTILFVLKHLVSSNEIKAGKTIFTAAFGPGLSIETMQLKYV
jgi:alpha-pyrone synthase